MYITCLDMEGVIAPEIWIEFSKVSGIPELSRTTRDEPDYDKLMNWRIAILKEHKLTLKDIQNTIAKIDPLPGAKEFLDELRSICQTVVLSDTFEEFAGPILKKLGMPRSASSVLTTVNHPESPPSFWYSIETTSVLKPYTAPTSSHTFSLLIFFTKNLLILSPSQYNPCFHYHPTSNDKDNTIG